MTIKAGDEMITMFGGAWNGCRVLEETETPGCWRIKILGGSDVVTTRQESDLEPVPGETPPSPLIAENERLKEALKLLKNERAKFQPSRIKDMSDEDRLKLELAAMRAFCGKTLEEGE